MVRRVTKSGRHAAPGNLRSLPPSRGVSLLDSEAVQLDERIRVRMDAEAMAAEAESVATDAAARASEAIAAAARAAEEADVAADVASSAAADAAAAVAEERSAAMTRAVMARDVALVRAASAGSGRRVLSMVRHLPGARRPVPGLGAVPMDAAMDAPTEQIAAVPIRAHDDDPTYDDRALDDRALDDRAFDDGGAHSGDLEALYRAGDAAPIAALQMLRERGYSLPTAQHPYADIGITTDDLGDPITDDDAAPRGGQRHSRRAPRAPGWITSRPVLIAAAAAGVIGLVLAVIVAVGYATPDAPAVETTATVPAPEPVAGAGPDQDGTAGTDDAADTSRAQVLGDRSAAAYLEALDVADISITPSGRTEIEAAVAICKQLKQGADDADLARVVPALLSSVDDDQADTVVTIAKTYYC